MNPLNFLKNRKKPADHPAATIIPIASGKGGVGKSFVSSNLAIAIAQMGYQVIAVDLDFGGANLHSFLGLSNRFPGIGDFLQARVAELDELLVSTDIPNLQFLSGDGKTPFMANMVYAQKIKLISRLKKLPADYILLDLGAGSSYNTLDFFRLAPHGIAVVSSIRKRIPFMLNFRDSLAAENIVRIAQRIEKFWDKPVTDSASLLINYVIKDSENRPASTRAA